MTRGSKLFLFSILLLISTSSKAQFLRATVGTDIPMQYLFGLNYQQGKHVSADLSIGYVGIPYNGDLYRVISVPEQHENRKTYLMETTDDGYVFGGGVNGHFKKWYGGVFFQRLELHASATYRYILGSDLFQEELNQDQKDVLATFLNKDLNLGGLADVNLDDVMRLTTVAWQAGLKVGRRFFFKNPRWEFRAEFAFSKNLDTETTSDYDEALFTDITRQYQLLKLWEKRNPGTVAQWEDEYGIKIPLDVDLDQFLDFEQREEDMDAWFNEYGYIPTLNFHVTYLLFVPNKVKEQQKKLDELKKE